MATSTVEQYLKTLLLLERRDELVPVPMKVLADAMSVTPGTVTSMAKHLAQQKLVTYIPRRGVELSASGRELALTILRRHRLLESFLQRVLGYDWGEVHAEAEELEHVVSEKFVDKVDELLGFPTADPHGDPIPRGGVIDSPQTRPVSELDTGRQAELAQVVDFDADFLALLQDHNIVPGASVRVTTRDPRTRTLTLDAGHGALTISTDLAGMIRYRL